MRTTGTSAVAQQAKWPLVMPASHVGALVGVLATAHLTYSSPLLHMEGSRGGTNTWAPVNHAVRDSAGVPDPGFGLAKPWMLWVFGE